MDILLGIRWYPSGGGWLAKTFTADDWWWSGVLSDSDKARLENFGITVEKPLVSGPGQNQGDWSGLIGGLYPDFEHFTFEPIALYADVECTQLNTDEVSNFYCTSVSGWNNTVVIASINAYTLPTTAWKCRITKIPHGTQRNSIELLMGFDYYIGQSPASATIGSSWVSILTAADKQAVLNFGLSTFDRDYTYGEIIPDFDNYVFEAVALYSDLSGNQQISFNMANISLSEYGSGNTLYITSVSDITAMSWKLRITKKHDSRSICGTMSANTTSDVIIYKPLNGIIAKD